MVPRVLFVPAPTIQLAVGLAAGSVTGLDDTAAFFGGERRWLAGRSERDQPGGAIVQEAFRELLERDDVDVTAPVERCHDRHPESLQFGGIHVAHGDTVMRPHRNEQFRSVVTGIAFRFGDESCPPQVVR